jgi:hypothetical protein
VVHDATAANASEVPVYGALYFVDADLPILTKLTFRGFPLRYPKQLAWCVNEPGPVPAGRIPELSRLLVDRFPIA